MSEKKNDILVIDDSLATSILIRDFLGKLGYVNVHTCSTGKTGIQIFSDLVHANKMPIVMLDFHLPDMTGDEVMTNIFNIKPNATIIIVTADAKTDEPIKETLRSGAYMYLEKPIRFQNLKSIFETLEREKEILDETVDDCQEKILSFLKSSIRTSLIRLHEYTDIDMEILEKHLARLVKEKKIIKVGTIKETSCKECGSIRTTLNFFCTSCHSSNFKQGKLIEHFKCGNVSVDESYRNNICPKCKKEIKILGVDYKTIENYYICNDCGNKFPEPFHDYICVKCNNRFPLEQAKWVVSDGYKINNPV